MNNQKTDQEKILKYLSVLEDSLDSSCNTVESIRKNCGGMLVHQVNNLYQVLESQKLFFNKAKIIAKKNVLQDTPKKNIQNKMIESSIELSECISLLNKILEDNKITDYEYNKFKEKSSGVIQSVGFLISEVEDFYKSKK